MTTEEEYARRLLDETREEITRADTKASIVLAGAGVAVGILLAGFVAGDLKLSNEPVVVAVPTIIAGGLLVAGVGLLASAVYPRTGTGVPGRAHYFADVARYEVGGEELWEAVRVASSDIIKRDLQQAHVLSRAALNKYRDTRRGMWFLAAGFALAGAAGLLSLAL